MVVVKVVVLEVLLWSYILSFFLVPWVAFRTSAELSRFVVLYISGPGVVLLLSVVAIIVVVLPVHLAVSATVRSPIVLLILHFIFTN